MPYLSGKITEFIPAYLRGQSALEETHNEKDTLRLIFLYLEKVEGLLPYVRIYFNDTMASTRIGYYQTEDKTVSIQIFAPEKDYDMIYSLLKDRSYYLDFGWEFDDTNDTTLTNWYIQSQSPTNPVKRGPGLAVENTRPLASFGRITKPSTKSDV